MASIKSGACCTAGCRPGLCQQRVKTRIYRTATAMAGSPHKADLPWSNDLCGLMTASRDAVTVAEAVRPDVSHRHRLGGLLPLLDDHDRAQSSSASRVTAGASGVLRLDPVARAPRLVARALLVKPVDRTKLVETLTGIFTSINGHTKATSTAVGRRAAPMMPKGERPHPRQAAAHAFQRGAFSAVR